MTAPAKLGRSPLRRSQGPVDQRFLSSSHSNFQRTNRDWSSKSNDSKPIIEFFDVITRQYRIRGHVQYLIFCRLIEQYKQADWAAVAISVRLLVEPGEILTQQAPFGNVHIKDSRRGLLLVSDDKSQL